MNAASVMVLAVLLLLCALAIRHSLRKGRGCSGCSSAGEGCPHCRGYSSKKLRNKKK